MVRYLKFTKKKLIRFLVFENHHLFEKVVCYQHFEKITAVVKESLEFCILNAVNFLSTVTKALSYVSLKCSLKYLKTVCNIVHVFLQNRLGWQFLSSKKNLYVTFKDKLKLSFYIVLKLSVRRFLSNIFLVFFMVFSNFRLQGCI